MPYFLECKGHMFGPYATEAEVAVATYRNFPTAVVALHQDQDTQEIRLLVWATPDHQRDKQPVAFVRVYDQPPIFTPSTWRLPS